MAKYKGKEGAVSSPGGNVAELRSFELTVTANEKDTSTMGSDWTENDSTQLSWAGSFECFWDPDNAGQTAFIVGQHVDVTFYPAGETTGKPMEGGNALIVSASRPQAHDDHVSQTIEFKGNGQLDMGGVVA